MKNMQPRGILPDFPLFIKFDVLNAPLRLNSFFNRKDAKECAKDAREKRPIFSPLTVYPLTKTAKMCK